MREKQWSAIKYIWGEANVILSVAGVFVTIICLIDFNSIVPKLWVRVLCVIIIFVISFLGAVLKITCVEHVEVDLENSRRAVLEFADLFNEDDQIVIPVNDSFDTIVDDVLIARKSVHGQFVIRYFENNTEYLDDLIKKALKGYKTEGSYEKEKLGNRDYYPLGTTITIQAAGKTFYLTALTHFNGCTVEPDLAGYYEAILRLFEYLNKMTAGKAVCMPLLGGGLARLGRTKEHILENLLSILKMNKTALPDKIHICLDKQLKEQINLWKFKE